MYYIVITINSFLTYEYVSYNELQDLIKNNVKFNHVFNDTLLYFK